MSNSVLEIVKNWSPNCLDKKDTISIKGNNYTALYHWLNTTDFDQSEKIRSGIIIAALVKELVKLSPLNATLITKTMIKVAGSTMKEADLL